MKEQMNEWTYGRTYEPTNLRTHERTNARTHEPTNVTTYVQMKERVNERLEEATTQAELLISPV